MEVDTAEVPSTSHNSSAGAAVCPKTKGVSASQAQAQLTGVSTNVRARRLSNAPLTNRAFMLWSRTLWSAMA